MLQGIQTVVKLTEQRALIATWCVIISMATAGTAVAWTTFSCSRSLTWSTSAKVAAQPLCAQVNHKSGLYVKMSA